MDDYMVMKGQRDYQQHVLANIKDGDRPAFLQRNRVSATASSSNSGPGLTGMFGNMFKGSETSRGNRPVIPPNHVNSMSARTSQNTA